VAGQGTARYWGTALLALCLLHGCSGQGSSGNAPTIETSPSTLTSFDSQAVAEGLADALSSALVEEDIDRVDRLLAGRVASSAVKSAAVSPLLAEVQELLADYRVLQYRLEVVESTPAPEGRVDLVLREIRTLAAGDGSVRTEVGRLAVEARAEPRAGGGVVLRLVAWERTPQATISQPDVPFLGESVSVAVALLAEGDLSGLTAELDGQPLGLSPTDGTETSIDTSAPMAAGLHTLTVRAAVLGEITHPLPVRGEELAQVKQLGPAGRYLSVATVGSEIFAGQATAGGLAFFPGADRFPVAYSLAGDGAAARLESIAVTPDGPDLLVVGGGDDRLARWQADGTVTDRLVIAADAAYPLRSDGLPAVPSRIVPAGDDLWLLGSDAGITRLTDGDPRFPTVLTRGDGLPANVIPAAIVRGSDDVVFAGLGGAAWWNGMGLTPISLATDITLDTAAIADLEGLFGAIAQAIFDHTPLATVSVGETSIEAIVGGALPKELLIFAAAQDGAGHLWLGTLGGGLWVVDGDGTNPRRFTRGDGLLSNVVLSLTRDPVGGVWVSTDEGATHIELVDGEPTFRELTPGNGLGTPVRQVAVADNGDIWFATDLGLFRLTERRHTVRGVVRDVAGEPLVGAMVTVDGAAATATTDATGAYVLQDVPVGKQTVRVVTTDGVRVESVVVGSGGEVGTPFRLVRISGDRQVGVSGETLPLPLVVRLEDEFGNPVVGETVVVRVRTGDGLLATTTVDGPLPTGTETEVATTTDVGGQAAVALTLGSSEADVQVRFAAAGRIVDFLAIVGEFDIPDTPLDIAARDLGGGQRVAAVAERQTGVVVIDGTIPVDPQEVAVLTVPGEPQKLALDGDFAYVAGFNPHGFYVLDLANPLDLPAESEPNDDPSTATVLHLPKTIRGKVASEDPGVSGLLETTDDIEDLYTFTLAEEATLGFGLSGWKVENVELYLLDENRTVVASDVDGRIGPTVLAAGQYYLGVTADDTRADPVPTTSYVITAMGAIDLEFLGNSARPAKVVVAGGHAYLGIRDNGTLAGSLQIIDVADAIRPRIVGSVETPQRIEGLALHGSTAIVTDRAGGAEEEPWRGVIAIDVADPTNPAIVSQLDGPFSASGVAVEGDFAYFIDTAGDSLARFTVADISDPTAMTIRGTFPFRPVEISGGSTIVVQDGFAYHAAFDLGVQVYDVQDPDTPRLVAVLDTPSTADAVALAGEFLYVADEIFGVLVVQGPGDARTDTDGDGAIDFFDAFPNDPTESLDVDGDQIGDNADLDDDNDAFSDDEETAAGTDTRNPKDFPVDPPDLSAGNTIYVDAAAALRGNGSAEKPYRTLTEATRAILDLRDAEYVDPIQVEVAAGVYSTRANGEIFPVNMNNLVQVSIVGSGYDETIFDAAQEGHVAFAQFADDLTIEGIAFVNGADGFLANHVNRLSLRDCRAAGNSSNGLEVGINAFDVVFEGNVAEDNGQNGLVLFETATGRFVDNVAVDNGWSGIAVSDGAQATLISGNEAVGNGVNGINVWGENEETGEHTQADEITDNTVRDSGSHGIAVHTGASADVVTDNTISGSTYNGIQGWNGGHYGEIVGNITTDNGSHGIAVWNGSSADRIAGNTSRDNAVYGLLVYDRSSVAALEDNDLSGNGSDGAFIFTTASVASASGNRYIGNTRFGLNVQSGSSYTGMGDVIAESQFIGVLVAAATLELTATTVRDTAGGSGVLATLGDTVVHLIDSTVTGSAGDGVVISLGASAIVEGGEISGNTGDGILLRADEPLVPGSTAPATASIAETGAAITIADNTDDGIDIEPDGSSATYDLGNIVFSGNGDQDIER